MKSLVLIFLGMLITIPAKAGYGDYYVVPGGPGYTADFFLPTAITVDYSSISDDQGRVLPTPASRNTKSTLAPPSTTTSKWPKKLAKKFPKEQRKDWQRVFSLSLKTYYKIEKKLKIPKRDIAGAIAAYIDGNYMAYHNIRISN